MSVVFSDSRNVQESGTQIIYLRPLPSSWSEGAAYTGWISPQILPFSKFLVAAQRAWYSRVSRLYDSPAKLFGIARALVVSL